MDNSTYNSIFKSRRKTPWDGDYNRTASQEFIRNEVLKHYAQRHPALAETNEAALLNSYSVEQCHWCGSADIKKNGFDQNGIQVYYCKACHRKFKITTNTIFDERKIAITEWIEFWRNLISYLSLTASSWNNKNAFNTSKHWFLKTCAILEHAWDDIILKGIAYYDETLVSERSDKLILDAEGRRLRGHSENQMTIGVAKDDVHTLAIYLGNGEPTQKAIYDAFGNHIEPGSTLITDKHRGHRKLVRELGLTNIEYDAKELRGVPDNENPLNPINQSHNQLQKFLRAHSGFNRKDLNNYLSMYMLIVNLPESVDEKIDFLLNLALRSAVSLPYRHVFLRD